MSRYIIAIPCVYYMPIEGADLGEYEAQYEAELYRTAWDSGAPLPEVTLLKPDMAGDLITMSNDLSLADDPDAPEYRVTFRLAPLEPTSYEATLIPKELLTGEHEILVKARNRYEAELLGVRKVLATHFEQEHHAKIGVIVTSVRMS